MFARIDVNGNQTSEGWILIVAYERTAFDEHLRECGASSVTGNVNLRGTPAANASPSDGPAVRLDWSLRAPHNDGTTEIGYIRSYWLHDGQDDDRPAQYYG